MAQQYATDFPAACRTRTVRRIALSQRLLSLCGGPDKTEGLDKFVQHWSARCTVYDAEIDPEHDLVDEGDWQLVKAELLDKIYDSTASAAPCSTFSGGRAYDGGRRPLRGEHPP